MKTNLLLTLFLLSSLYLLSQTVPSYIPTSGLVSYWGFANTTNDYTTNGNNGTIVGSSSFVYDRFGNVNSAFRFVANTDIVCTTNSFNNIQVFSISFWFKTANSGFVFGSNNGQCTHRAMWDRYVYIKPNGNAEFYVFNGTQKYCTATGNYKDDLWHNAVAVLSPAGMKLYIDGVLSGQNNNTTAAQNYVGYWRMGGLQSGGYNTLIGDVDDIGLWNRALTSVEVTSVFQSSTLNVKNENLPTFKIFPNPASDNLTIESNSKQDSFYEIIDQFGRVIKSGVLANDKNILDVKELAAGIYVLKISGDINKNYKFIKN